MLAPLRLTPFVPAANRSVADALYKRSHAGFQFSRPLDSFCLGGKDGARSFRVRYSHRVITLRTLLDKQSILRHLFVPLDCKLAQYVVGVNLRSQYVGFFMRFSSIPSTPKRPDHIHLVKPVRLGSMSRLTLRQRGPESTLN